MENTLGLLENSGGGIGREVPSGGSTTGSMSTVDNLVFSSEVSSCYPDENNDSDELELGLGLSLGGGGASASLNKSLKAPSWCGNGQYARILTAKDLPSMISKSSSSSSPTVPKANHKRIAADSVSPPNGSSSQVVGWPPVRAYRMNSLNQAKLSITEDFSSIVDKSENVVVNKDNNSCNKQGNDTMDKGPLKTSLFVKVNMDGTAIGRKVDLSAHNCYETLARTLEDMFCRSNRTANTRSSMEGHNLMVEAGESSKLLVGSSEYVLTYEDKEGDWMLVGDVPWRMFVSSVKRLRIMRTSEANGLAPKIQERHGRQRARAI